MPSFDDRLTTELERAARPAAPDPVRTFDEVVRRRAHRTAVRKIQVVAAVVALLVAIGGAFALLDSKGNDGVPLGTGTGAPPTPSVAAYPASMVQWRPVKIFYGTDDISRTCEPGSCTESDLRPNAGVILDDADGMGYGLGPTIADGTEVTSVQMVHAPGGGSVVNLQLDPAATTRFEEATRTASSEAPPKNQIAVIADGLVLRAVTVIEPISSGSVQITVADETIAQQLVATLATTSSATPTSEPGQDVGLPFRMCRIERMTGLDLQPGSTSTALVGGEVIDGACSDQYEGPTVLAVDVQSDGVADTWAELPRCMECRPFGAFDLSGDGADELFVVLQGSASPDYGVYRLEDGEIRPVIVRGSGDPYWGLVPGEPLVIWAGGDEGYSYAVACTASGSTTTLTLTHSRHAVEAPIGSTYPRRTTVVAVDADGARVISASTEQLTLGDPVPPAPTGGCALDFAPGA